VQHTFKPHIKSPMTDHVGGGDIRGGGKEKQGDEIGVGTGINFAGIVKVGSPARVPDSGRFGIETEASIDGDDSTVGKIQSARSIEQRPVIDAQSQGVDDDPIIIDEVDGINLRDNVGR